MTVTTSIKKLVDEPVSLTGRGRLPQDLYWLGFAGILACNYCIVYSINRSGGVPDPATALSTILVLWAWIVLFVRRGHDFGINGFTTMLVVALVMGACLELAKYAPLTSFSMQASLIAIFGLVRGTPGPNRFGMPMARRT